MTQPPIAPLRMAVAMKFARRLYFRYFLQFVALYTVILAVPLMVSLAALRETFDQYAARVVDAPGASYWTASNAVWEEAFQQLSPGGSHYLLGAFNVMLYALIYPFAVAATIELLTSVIVLGAGRMRDSLKAILPLWLGLVQFGLLWYIVLYTATSLVEWLVGALPLPPPVKVAMFFVSLGVLVGLWWFAYVAALVATVIERADPLRAAYSGSRFALSHTRALWPFGWRIFVLTFLLSIVSSWVPFASETVRLVVSTIVPILVIGPYIVLSTALYAVDALQRSEASQSVIATLPGLEPVPANAAEQVARAVGEPVAENAIETAPLSP